MHRRGHRKWRICSLSRKERNTRKIKNKEREEKKKGNTERRKYNRK
jgi:hypothetical protein